MITRIGIYFLAVAGMVWAMSGVSGAPAENKKPEVPQAKLFSHEEMMETFAKDIVFVLQNEKAKFLPAADDPKKKILVCVPEFLPEESLLQKGMTFESPRKEFARMLEKSLKKLSFQANDYEIVEFEAVQIKSKMKNADRNNLSNVRQVDKAAFVWINGTIELYNAEKSIFRVSCEIRQEKINITVDKEVKKCIVLNLDDHVDAKPMCITPQVNPAKDKKDTAKFKSIVVSQFDKPAKPTAELNALRNDLMQPMIWVKKQGAPPMGNNPTDAEFSEYVSENYEWHPLTPTENNELRIKLDPGREFMIALEIHPLRKGVTFKSDTKGNKPYLFARVLVDGRNTIYQQAIDPVAPVQVPANNQRIFRSAESVLVKNAEPWFIPEENIGGYVVIPGFVSKEQRFPRAFLMTDEKVRDPKGNIVSDYTGLIQIVVYEPMLPGGDRRGVVKPGEQIPHEMQTVITKYIPGNMIGVWTIQYGK